jgi:crossover junction endodeoxyribonuclease RuvC
MSEAIRILGIDPGLRHTGWGIIDVAGSRLIHVDHGVINIDPDLPMADRLAGIFHAIGRLVNMHKPDYAGCEETIVNVNPRSALKLGQARGAAMTSLSFHGLEVSEFAPTAIKRAIVGSGRADKDQIQFMIARLLPRAGKMKADAADALACAICTAHNLPHKQIQGAA